MKPWMAAIAVLVLLALFFFFCLRGYGYISATLLFIAALIAVFSLGSAGLIRAVCIVTGIGLIWFCAMEYLIVSASRTDDDAGRGWLIVLGAAVHGSEPSLALTHRLQGAQEYLLRYPEARVVVSGGQGAGEDISEAECMRIWLEQNGIAPERIFKEDRSVSTLENLRFSLEIITANGGQADDIAVVSSGYHLYRAKKLAESVGITAAGYKGHPGYPIYTLGMYIREAFGVTHMIFFGN